jgi:hypothetical protein
VVKQALVLANTNRLYTPIKAATYGIIFMGTPHRGTNLAAWGRMTATIAKAVLVRPKTQLLKALESNSRLLMDLSAEFAHMHSLFRIVNCYEQKETKLPGLLKSAKVMVWSMSLRSLFRASFEYLLTLF